MYTKELKDIVWCYVFLSVCSVRLGSFAALDGFWWFPNLRPIICWQLGVLYGVLTFAYMILMRLDVFYSYHAFLRYSYA